WCNKIRAQARNIYPTDVHLVDRQGDLLANAPGASVLVVEELTIGEKELAAAGNSLRFVQKYGFTTRNIDGAACARAEVEVLTIRRRANISTAEQALALMLALARQLTRNANLISVEQLKNAGFEPTTYDRSHTPNGNWARIPGMVTLYQRQLGIVGLGEIGRELALRSVALGMRILYTQRTRLPEDVERQYHASYCPLDELLAESDFVSLHLPRGPATVNFIGARELSVVKPGAFLINVSQPNLVDREALRQSLASGRLGGYGLDTFYEEPGDANDPLIQFSNVVITPHLGGSPRWNSLDDIEEVIANLGRALA
ncbi:MAG TPA: NAD(P)-dependent oxidoreductase, partial [Candidatus Binatia bacterium]|nr:NAD(P)-dependent oxidoreductase [Candidatus Binatia bacterium]